MACGAFVSCFVMFVVLPSRDTALKQYMDHPCFFMFNICQVTRKLFEHETAEPSVQISSEGPGKCYCNEITMDDR